MLTGKGPVANADLAVGDVSDIAVSPGHDALIAAAAIIIIVLGLSLMLVIVFDAVATELRPTRTRPSATHAHGSTVLITCGTTVRAQLIDGHIAESTAEACIWWQFQSKKSLDKSDTAESRDRSFHLAFGGNFNQSGFDGISIKGFE